MEPSRIAFIELTVFSGVYPLASGYMRTYCEQHPQVREAYDYSIHSICINNAGFEAELDQIDAEIYAISCYVWNMGFVRRWLPKLMARKPNARVILGGPQVMNQGKRYLGPDNERIVICNGEGEHTFTNFIAELLEPTPDLSKVLGLSFYRNGQLITTPPQERIKDLNSTPSPYLQGHFDPTKYVWASIESNRGCPYQCTYCFWGAATNAKVFKSDIDRVKAEITWLAQNRALYIFITDANFGMLNRDIEIAEHLAECKRKYSYPLTVFFSAAKNSPERVTEITKVLSAVELISTQPVSLQTMDANTLASVKRSNIKESSYVSLQKDLHEHNLASFIEMIWPLPGETLASFKAGLGKLCSSGADAFVIHHLLLINNVEMNEQREEYQLQVTDDADPNSEAQVVIATRDVSHEEYKEGVRFGYHVTSLYSLRSLKFVGQYLDTTERMIFKDLFTAFSAFCAERPDHPYMRYINEVINLSGQTKFSANGGIFHVTMHEARQQFDHLLHDFLDHLGFLEDEFIGFLLELDLVNRPHVYYNTPISYGEGLLRQISVLERTNDGVVVEIPEKYARTASLLLGLGEGGRRYSVKYHSTQMPFMPNKPHEDNLSYCEAKLHKMGSILPIWTAENADYGIGTDEAQLALMVCG